MGQKETIWNKDFIIVFLVNIVAYMGFQMLNPNITKYASSLGIVSTLVGIIAAAYSFAALLSRPFSGMLTDKMSKKNILLASLLGLALCFLGYMVTTNAYGLMVIRFVHGVFFGFNSTVTMTMASNALPPRKLSSGLGVFGLSSVGSMAIAPSIGIAIVDSLGYTALFLIGAVLTVLSGICALFVKKDVPNRSARGPFSIHNLVAVQTIPPALIGLMVSSTSGLVSSYLVLHGDARNIANVGVYFTVYAVTLLVVRPLIGKLADTVSPAFVIYPCCAATAATMLVLGFAHSTAAIVAAGILFGIGYGGIHPVIQTLCIKSVVPERRGVASSTFYMGLDVGNTLGPFVGGLLIPLVNYGGTFFCFVIPPVLGALVMVWIQISNRGKDKAKIEKGGEMV